MMSTIQDACIAGSSSTMRAPNIPRRHDVCAVLEHVGRKAVTNLTPHLTDASFNSISAWFWPSTRWTYIAFLR